PPPPRLRPRPPRPPPPPPPAPRLCPGEPIPPAVTVCLLQLGLQCFCEGTLGGCLVLVLKRMGAKRYVKADWPRWPHLPGHRCGRGMVARLPPRRPAQRHSLRVARHSPLVAASARNQPARPL